MTSSFGKNLTVLFVYFCCDKLFSSISLIMMNPNVYRWCAVPQCKNTSMKTPNKLFINVSTNKNVRNMWLKLARRDTASVSSNSVIYFCEDHFDLPNDMENYMEYHIMGSVSKVRMKSGCVPTRFECQPDRRKRAFSTTEWQIVHKKQRKLILEEIENSLEMENKPTTSLETVKSSVIHTTKEQEQGSTCPKFIDKAVQAQIFPKFRSKAWTKIITINQLTSPLKPDRCSISTSPFKIECYGSNKSTTLSLLKTSKRIFTIDDQSDSDISYTPSLIHKDSSPSIQSLQAKSSSDCSELIEEAKKEDASNILKYTLYKIMRNTRSYIGLPKNCSFLLNIIEEETKIPFNHILLCLEKIKLNIPFRQLSDDSAINSTYASKIFFKNIPLIASVLRPFIVTLDNELTKRNLPIAFRQFHNTSCIIDCLEIVVQKPTKSVHQAVTWSEYKKNNTIKYLVSCTPNGLVNYISPGYGGRVSDTCLVETCDFIKCLQPGMCVMADRGFKHIDQYLRREGVKLVRPPSVVTGVKLSKIEAKETKQIASLRIHVERLIRRLREFNMLKPHSGLNTNFVKVLDEVIVIACALVNLLNSLIK